MDHPIDATIDAKGKKCPMPVLMASRGLKTLQPGQVMLIEATDNGSQSDIPSWARDTGNELLEATTVDGVHRYVVRKS
ncbi:sulfurtransferase TusA family protein [Intrasporangium calvum]|uniref:SirA-like domain-containing protein n=1 Tax=Intrasporangium calvum (strain ATCC 23552 / DSM 43043 / JCM 3097 / NBRC 12989 / NCIMB 10167 / NRRL B-3866 / 7 KIP) TaxID=710696 RepID=E6SA74_INTC7|nr:sulfurtransferase TusA family protein [Intrasporangium calvum]ADU49322.1 SirA-like domain-containing protein [Intrasporangium calvum DSM 43043]AXG14238.1 sulfurtransferase TusA family protein [Intrasporangium calvum]